MVRLVVAGAAGRMGRMIVAAADGNAGCGLAGAVERPGNQFLGQDAGQLAGVGDAGVLVTDNLAAALRAADVLVDFTMAEALPEHLDGCVAAGVGMVIGTTGLGAAGKAAVADAAARIPIVQSANMSVGVNVLTGLLRAAAQALGAGYDIEIIEAHHRMKRDSPSGTALLLRDAVAEGRGFDAEKGSIYGRHGMAGPRPETEIGIHAVRGGDIVGDHTVLFAGPGERLEFIHRAHSRETFAQGAIRAALWVAKRRPGFYTMLDVLGLTTGGVG